MLTISLIVMMGIEISTILAIYLTYVVIKNNFKKPMIMYKLYQQRNTF